MSGGVQAHINRFRPNSALAWSIQVTRIWQETLSDELSLLLLWCSHRDGFLRTTVFPVIIFVTETPYAHFPEKK